MFIIKLFKMGSPFLQSLGTLSDCYDFSKMMESALAIATAKFPQDPGIYVFGSHGLCPGSSGGLESDLLQ